MADRLVIEINGDLPEKGKHGIIDAAERAVDEFIAQFGAEHKIVLTGSARSVRPGKKAAAAAPIEQAGTTASMIPLVTKADVQAAHKSDPKREAAD